jgi:hypothetical protein
MKNYSIISARIELILRKSDGCVLSIRNRTTDEVVCSNGTQSVLIRTPLEPNEPALLSEVLNVVPTSSGVEIEFADASKAYHARLSISACDKGFRFSIKAATSKPIWLIEWRLGGLQLQRVIVPALGGQSLEATMASGTTLSYKYPFWWNAQFVVGEMKDGTCCLSSQDADPQLKLLRVKKERSGFAVTYGIEASAPLTSLVMTGEWFLDCSDGDWHAPVDQHRRWMQSQFDLCPLDENPFLPEWMKHINFVLEMWGVTKDRSEPLHTFDQMIERLKK